MRSTVFDVSKSLLKVLIIRCQSFSTDALLLAILCAKISHFECPILVGEEKQKQKHLPAAIFFCTLLKYLSVISGIKFRFQTIAFIIFPGFRRHLVLNAIHHRAN